MENHKRINYVIIIIASIMIMFHFLKMNIIQADDGMIHVLRIIGTYISFGEGNIPGLINEHFINELGYSTNLFYNPITTFFPFIIKLFVPSFKVALQIFTLLTIILSGIFMHQFVWKITKSSKVSLLASILYISAPYRFTDIYIRFAIGEFTSFVFLPLVFLGVYHFIETEDNKGIKYLVIGTVGIILTHTVTLIYTFILVVLYLLLNIEKVVRRIKNKKILWQSLISLIFILGISAFFFVPLFECKFATEYTIFDSQIMGTNGAYVHGNALTISEALYKATENIDDTHVLYHMGYPTLLCLILSILVWKKIRKEYKEFYLVSFILGLICLFMATKYFPWQAIPDILCTIQFPWRMIGFATLFFSIVASINFCIFLEDCIKNQKAQNRMILLVILFIVYMGISAIKPYISTVPYQEDVDIKYENKILENPNIDVMEINRDYLPIKAMKNLNYINNRKKEIIILEGNGILKNENKDGLKYTFEINTLENTCLEMPFIYYPGYVAHIEDGQVEIMESENGLISLTIPKGYDGNVIVEYKLTEKTKIAYVVSFISTLCFIIYIIKTRKEELIYERKD